MHGRRIVVTGVTGQIAFPLAAQFVDNLAPVRRAANVARLHVIGATRPARPTMRVYTGSAVAEPRLRDSASPTIICARPSSAIVRTARRPGSLILRSVLATTSTMCS